MRTFTPDFHELADAELVEVAQHNSHVGMDSLVDLLCERSEAFVRETLASLRVAIYDGNGRVVGRRTVLVGAE